MKWTNAENNGSVFTSLLFSFFVNTEMDWQVIKTLQSAQCENYSKSSNQQLTLLLSKLCIHQLYFVFDIQAYLQEKREKSAMKGLYFNSSLHYLKSSFQTYIFLQFRMNGLLKVTRQETIDPAEEKKMNTNTFYHGLKSLKYKIVEYSKLGHQCHLD